MYPGHSRFYFFLCLAIWVIWGNTGRAQIPDPINFDTPEGLPSSEVYDAEVDVHGQVWFATDRGITVYNGYEFETFGLRDGISNISTLKIFPGRQGQLWFNGIDGSMTEWENGLFKPFSLNDTLKSLLKGGHWIQRAGVDQEGTLFLTAPDSLRSICYYLEEGSHRLNIGDWDSLAQLPSAWNLPPYTFLELNQTLISNRSVSAEAFTLDHQSLYFVTSSSDSIVCFDRNHSEKNQRRKIDRRLLDLYVAHSGDLWAATVDGLLRFPQGDLSLEPRLYFEGMAISGINQDPEGNFWLTTLSNGVLLVPTFEFETLGLEQTPAQSSMVLLPLENHLIIGTQVGKIFALDRKGKVDLLVHTPGHYDTYKHGSVCGNRAWILSHSFVESPQGIKVKQGGLTQLAYLQTLELSSGRLLISGRRGYQVLEPDQSPHYNSIGSFSTRILHTLENDQGIWLGTIKGLYRLPPGQFDQPEAIAPKNPLFDCRINDLCSDDRGNLWVATIGNGLLFLGKEDTVQISTDDGLDSDLINTLFLLDDTTLLAGSNQGLNMISYSLPQGKLRLHAVRKPSQEYGIPGQFVRDVVAWQGQIWMSTNQGLLHFDPQNLPLDPPRGPTIFLTDVRINHQSVGREVATELKYDHNDLDFHFSGISHRKPLDRPFYGFRLVEGDEVAAWNYTNDRSVQYFNLDPGDYRFEVKARNRLDQWSEFPLQYAFTIRPHFTQTPWFRYGLICFVLLVASVIMLWYRRRIHQRAAEQMKLNAFQLRVQAAEITALRNQINPHFVFNVLNSIQNYYFKNDPVKANRYLSKFSRLMRDGLQFSGMKLISLRTELDFIRTYLELEQMRFPDRFSFALEVDPEIDLATTFLPPFLFQPVLENAVKHAFGNIPYPGLLSIKMVLDETGEQLLIEIVDNGPGLHGAIKGEQQRAQDRKGLHQSFGLQLVRDQIHLLNVAGGVFSASFELRDQGTENAEIHGVKAIYCIPIAYQVPV